VQPLPASSQGCIHAGTRANSVRPQSRGAQPLRGCRSGRQDGALRKAGQEGQLGPFVSCCVGHGCAAAACAPQLPCLPVAAELRGDASLPGTAGCRCRLRCRSPAPAQQCPPPQSELSLPMRKDETLCSRNGCRCLVTAAPSPARLGVPPCSAQHGLLASPPVHCARSPLPQQPPSAECSQSSSGHLGLYVSQQARPACVPPRQELDRPAGRQSVALSNLNILSSSHIKMGF
jgi:hypothetical protein